MRESHESDPKPGDLVLCRMKFSERRMEVRTSVVYMHLDDLGLGVKSHSNSAMAGSCRNMPKYSLTQFISRVKYGLGLQNRKVTKLAPTQNLLIA